MSATAASEVGCSALGNLRRGTSADGGKACNRGPGRRAARRRRVLPAASPRQPRQLARPTEPELFFAPLGDLARVPHHGRFPPLRTRRPRRANIGRGCRRRSAPLRTLDGVWVAGSAQASVAPLGAQFAIDLEARFALTPGTRDRQSARGSGRRDPPGPGSRVRIPRRHARVPRAARPVDRASRRPRREW